MTQQALTLRDLIDRALERHQVKHVSNLEVIAKRGGHEIVATTINGIRSGAYNSRPKRKTLEALAFLAGVVPEVAYEAADLPVPGPPFAEQLPEGVDLLSPREREAAIGVLRAMVDARRALTVDRTSGETEAMPRPDLRKHLGTYRPDEDGGDSRRRKG